MTRARDLADGKFATDVEVENSTAGAQNMLVIHHASNTSGDESKIQFKRTTDAGSDREVAAIVADRIGGNDTDLAFETNTDGADGAVEKMRLSHLGILSVDQVFGLSDTDTGIALGANGADIMQFYTGNTERARLLSGGGLDLSAGHLVLDNGYGIDFSAASSASGMSSEILDDYEEGTWTATFTGTSTTATGRYVKIGGQVFVTVYGDSLNVTSSVTGTVGGLPFTNSGGYTACTITHDTYTTNSYNGYVNTGGTTMTAIQDGTVSGSATVVGNPKYIMISAVYYTTS